MFNMALTDLNIIDNAIDEWRGLFAHVCGQKADTSSNYCENIQPYYKRRFSFLTRFLDCLCFGNYHKFELLTFAR